MLDIEFEHVDPSAAPGEYMSIDEPSPYFKLEDGEELLKWMLNPDEVVITEPLITVQVQYPFKETFLFPLQAPDPNIGFTRSQLALGISTLYKWIYKVEKQTTRKPIKNIPGLLNRDRTNGYFGIWGHCLGDLDLHTVTYDPDTKMCKLGIDS
jgi:hypothetical protein